MSNITVRRIIGGFAPLAPGITLLVTGNIQWAMLASLLFILIILSRIWIDLPTPTTVGRNHLPAPPEEKDTDSE